MKGKKVYVLHIRQVFDDELLRDDVEAFENYDNAKEKFDEFVDDERQNVESADWVIDSDTETEFECYDDGYYNSNHTYASIETLTIQ